MCVLGTAGRYPGSRCLLAFKFIVIGRVVLYLLLLHLIELFWSGLAPPLFHRSLNQLPHVVAEHISEMLGVIVCRPVQRILQKWIKPLIETLGH